MLLNATRHNFSFLDDKQSLARQNRYSSKHQISQSPRFEKENMLVPQHLPKDKFQRILQHNYQLLAENEKLSVRMAQLQIIRHNNTQLERNNSNLRENLHMQTMELQSFQSKYEYFKRETNNQINQLKAQIDLLKQKIDEQRNRSSSLQSMMRSYKQQQEKKLTSMGEKLVQFERLVNQKQQTLSMIHKDKKQLEMQLEHQRQQFNYSTKHMQEQTKLIKDSQERQLRILREQLEKKQLEIVYVQKLSAQELNEKQQELNRLMNELREKHSEELQAIQIIRILERERDEAIHSQQLIREKIRNLERDLLHNYDGQVQQLEKAYQSRIENYRKQNKQYAKANDQLKKSLDEKVEEAEELQSTLEEMSQLVRQLKVQCHELYEKYSNFERNFEGKLEQERNNLRQSYQMILNNRMRDNQAREVLNRFDKNTEWKSHDEDSDLDEDS